MRRQDKRSKPRAEILAAVKRYEGWPMRKEADPAVDAKLRELFAAGKPISKIGKELAMSKGRVTTRIHQMGLVRPGPAAAWKKNPITLKLLRHWTELQYGDISKIAKEIGASRQRAHQLAKKIQAALEEDGGASFMVELPARSSVARSGDGEKHSVAQAGQVADTEAML